MLFTSGNGSVNVFRLERQTKKEETKERKKEKIEQIRHLCFFEDIALSIQGDSLIQIKKKKEEKAIEFNKEGSVIKAICVLSLTSFAVGCKNGSICFFSFFNNQIKREKEEFLCENRAVIFMEACHNFVFVATVRKKERKKERNNNIKKGDEKKTIFVFDRCNLEKKKFSFSLPTSKKERKKERKSL